MISIVVLTLNEAANLPRCLASVGFSDDVLVIDSGSSDDTVAIAGAAGARIVERAFDSFAQQRNAAHAAGLRHKWVLHLDADEVVTPALAAELMAIAESDQEHAAYRVASRLMFRGAWLKHAGMYPVYQVRFGRASVLRFIDVGHGQREAPDVGPIGTLVAPLDHYNFSRGIGDWFTRHTRYAALEAARAGRREWPRLATMVARDAVVRRRALKQLADWLPCRPLLRFFYSYIIRRGFLDGRAGFDYSCMMAIYQYLIDQHMVEQQTKEGTHDRS